MAVSIEGTTVEADVLLESLKEEGPVVGGGFRFARHEDLADIDRRRQKLRRGMDGVRLVPVSDYRIVCSTNQFSNFRLARKRHGFAVNVTVSTWRSFKGVRVRLETS